MTTTTSAEDRDRGWWASARTLLWPGGERPGRRAVLHDTLLWLVLAVPVAGQAALLGLSDGDTPLTALGRALLWSAVLAALIAMSRYSPLVPVLVAVLCCLALPFFAPPLAVLSYLLGRRSPRAWPSAVGFALLVAGGLGRLVLTAAPPPDWMGGFFALLTMVVLPWMVGNYRRRHQELMFMGWEHAKQMEREGRFVADEARLRERSRIAQDMHDSLGHELSLIALRAGALEVAADLDERHRNAVGELREGAMTATDRLREIIGVLRDDSDPAPREPADEGIAALVERARASGVEVRLVRGGEATELAPMADRAAYRVVQEGITNATKHAPGATVLVRIEGGAEGTAVEVRNAAPPAGPLPGRSQGGRGLIGLAERVRLAGGAMRAGADDEGGFALFARFPLPDQALADAGTEAAPEEGRFDRDLRLARRRLRNRLFALLAVPVVMAAVAVPVSLGLAYYEDNSMTLRPEDYAELHVGQRESAVRERLPREEYEPDFTVHEPPVPDGAHCVYYRSQGTMFASGFFDVYRLCFEAGRLVAKDSYAPLGKGDPTDEATATTEDTIEPRPSRTPADPEKEDEPE